MDLDSFQDPNALKTLSFDKITHEKVKNCLKHVRLGGNSSKSFVVHLGKKYVLPKFKDRERIVQ